MFADDEMRWTDEFVLLGALLAPMPYRPLRPCRREIAALAKGAIAALVSFNYWLIVCAGRGKAPLTQNITHAWRPAVDMERESENRL